MGSFKNQQLFVIWTKNSIFFYYYGDHKQSWNLSVIENRRFDFFSSVSLSTLLKNLGSFSNLSVFYNLSRIRVGSTESVVCSFSKIIKYVIFAGLSVHFFETGKNISFFLSRDCELYFWKDDLHLNCLI
jgi:hypothetical protein